MIGLVNPVSVEYLNRQQSVPTTEMGLALAAVHFGGKNTRELGQVRVWAGPTGPTAGPETCLEVLEGLRGRRGLVVAHCGSKDTDRGGPRKIFLLLWFFFCLFCFVQLMVLLFLLFITFLIYIFFVFLLLLYFFAVLCFFLVFVLFFILFSFFLIVSMCLFCLLCFCFIFHFLFLLV